jgi:hypothetical protein
MSIIINQPRSEQVTGTMSQSITAGADYDYSISIPIFASTAVAWVIGATAIGGGTAGYPGGPIAIRPASGTGRSASIMAGSYNGAFSSSLISQLSDLGMFGTLIRLADAWISNSTGTVVFRFRNTGAGAATGTAHITALVFP